MKMEQENVADSSQHQKELPHAGFRAELLMQAAGQVCGDDVKDAGCRVTITLYSFTILVPHLGQLI